MNRAICGIVLVVAACGVLSGQEMVKAHGFISNIFGENPDNVAMPLADDWLSVCLDYDFKDKIVQPNYESPECRGKHGPGTDWENMGNQRYEEITMYETPQTPCVLKTPDRAILFLKTREECTKLLNSSGREPR